MAKPGIVRYPRGFTRPEGPSFQNTFSDGDGEWNSLYAIWLTGRAESLGWSYKAQLLKVAVRLFSNNFSRWAADQITNPFVHGYNYDFLIDTLRYLTGEQRYMSIRSWEGLVSEHRLGPYGYENHDESVPRALLASLPNDLASILSVWCGKPQGFEDLLKTLNLCFGRTYDLASAPASVRPLLN